MTDSSSSGEDRLASALQGVEASEYGPDYRNHALEMYKTYLEMADRISERREKANVFFLTVNTALVALIAKGFLGDSGSKPAAIEVFIPLAAVVLCYLWYRIIRSYRDLNSAKFKVIHVIERQLPFRPHDAEWESVGRGKNPKLYLPFTHIEGLVPLIFILLHTLLALFAVPWGSL